MKSVVAETAAMMGEKWQHYQQVAARFRAEYNRLMSSEIKADKKQAKNAP